MFFVVLGSLLIGIGLTILLSDLWKRIRCRKVVEGRIVDTYVRVESVGNARCYVNYYYPVYEYVVNGKTYQAQPEQSSKMKDWYKIGDVVNINYNPYNPNEMVILKYWGEVLAGSAFILAGIGILIFYMIH